MHIFKGKNIPNGYRVNECVRYAINGEYIEKKETIEILHNYISLLLLLKVELLTTIITTTTTNRI